MVYNFQRNYQKHKKSKKPIEKIKANTKIYITSTNKGRHEGTEENRKDGKNIKQIAV